MGYKDIKVKFSSRESEKFPLYFCDPEKNAECRKTAACFAYGGKCNLTKKRECAKLDENGEPLVKYASYEAMLNEFKSKK